ncbi:MAG: putative lipid II flippase FtsW [Candidatus Dormibacteraeota bacterium]|nr:putative lipid II flippase FtsW [Candidatus Dormibacteraeota bacterium]
MAETVGQRVLPRERATGDLWLLGITLALLGAGLIMVLSASDAYSLQTTGSAFNVFFHQVGYAALGLVGLVVASRIDYHRLRHWALPAFVATVVLMLAVLVPHLGASAYGASRWINIPGFPIQLQPSEVAKLSVAVFLASWMSKRTRSLDSFVDGFLPYAVLMAIVIGLLILQKDLGTLIVTTVMMIAVYYAGGGRMRYLVLLGAAALGAMGALVVAEPYRVGRVTTFLNPFADPSNKTLQAYQGLVALGSGGLTGVGLGHSIEKYQWLPEAPTDFIFAIIGEETGLIGATLIIVGFVFFTIRGFRAAMRAPDRFGVALGAAITTWISVQAFINIGVVTASLPVTGVPLPFISYGGTALVITLTGVGVLLNISAQGSRPSLNGERRGNAAAHRGRGNRGPRVSGARDRTGVSS